MMYIVITVYAHAYNSSFGATILQWLFLTFQGHRRSAPTSILGSPGTISYVLSDLHTCLGLHRRLLYYTFNINIPLWWAGLLRSMYICWFWHRVLRVGTANSNCHRKIKFWRDALIYDQADYLMISYWCLMTLLRYYIVLSYRALSLP